MSNFLSEDYKNIPIVETKVGGYYFIYPNKKIWYGNNMKFSQYKESEEKYGIASGGDWMALEEGDNRIRIVSEFVDYGEHFDNAKKRSFVCLGKDECSYCKAGEKVKVRYLGWVIDRKDGKVKLLRFGHSIFKQIGALAINEEYEFDESPSYDMTIKRDGKGLDTEYNVTAARKDSKITEKELEEIEEKVKDPIEIIENMKAKLEKEIGSEGSESHEVDEYDEEMPPPEPDSE